MKKENKIRKQTDNASEVWDNVKMSDIHVPWVKIDNSHIFSMFGGRPEIEDMFS